MHWVEMLPDTQTPSWLGLPSNAEKVLLTTQGTPRPPSPSTRLDSSVFRRHRRRRSFLPSFIHLFTLLIRLFFFYLQLDRANFSNFLIHLLSQYLTIISIIVCSVLTLCIASTGR